MILFRFFIVLIILSFPPMSRAINNSIEVSLDPSLLSKSKFITIVSDERNNEYVEYKNNLLEPKIDYLDCEDKNAANRQKYKAVWLWDYKRALNSPKETVAKLKDIGINMIFIQISKNLDEYSKFINEANKQDIEVSALVGEPNFIYNDTAIFFLQDVINYNKKSSNKFAGFQIDVEPYTLAGFEINKDIIVGKYLRLIQSLNSKKENLEFSVVLPFWFSNLRDNSGHDYINEIYKNVDFVSVMSYRTSYKKILNISNNTLCLAAKADKNVLLSIELLPLPNETHTTFSSRDIVRFINHSKDDNMYIAQIPLDLAIQKFHVDSSEISFNNNIDAGLSIIDNERPPYLSFLGWSINGIEKFLFD